MEEHGVAGSDSGENPSRVAGLTRRQVLQATTAAGVSALVGTGATGQAGASSADWSAQGHVTVDSTGTIEVDGLGFRPDYIEFITHQQVESVPTEIVTPENEGCPENVNGWSRGLAVFDGESVDTQLSLTAVRNSNSTNGHRVASSSSYAVNQIYVDDDGYRCGSDSALRVSVTGATDDGFVLEVDDRHVYDETIFFAAYDLPDGADVEIGFETVDETGESEHPQSLGFQPDYIEFVAGQQIHGMDVEARRYNQPNGLSVGIVETNNLTEQYSISYGATSDSTDYHRRATSDQYPVNVIYDQDATLSGRLRAAVEEVTTDGFTLGVSEYWVDSPVSAGETILYLALGLPDSGVDAGFIQFTGTGAYELDTGFEPADLKLVTMNRHSEMGWETTDQGDSSCGGGGEIGYSTGYVHNESGNPQYSVSTGRNSSSMNAHITAASDSYALNSIYTHTNGEFCGTLTGEALLTESGFTIDVQAFWDDEVTLYRALDLAEPADVAVAVTETTEPVIEGETLEVTAQIENTGDKSATQTLTLEIDGEEKDAAERTLAGGETDTLTLEWETGDGDAGSYQAAVASGDDSDETAVTVGEPAAFGVTLTDVSEPVVEGETLEVTADIENTGDEGDTQTLTLTVDGQEKETAERTLTGGETDTLTLEWNTGDDDAGSYQAAVASEDDSDETAVTVHEAAAFTVAITETNAPVEAGDTLDVTAHIENTTNGSDSQPITLEVNGREVDSETVALESGEDRTVTLEWTATNRNGVGVRVASEDDTDNSHVSLTTDIDDAGEVAIEILSTNTPVSEGDTLSVDVKLTNTGDATRSQDVHFDVDARREQTQNVTLDAGESVIETFTWSVDARTSVGVRVASGGDWDNSYVVLSDTDFTLTGL